MYKVNISKGYEAYPAGEVTDITEEIKKLKQEYEDFPVDKDIDLVEEIEKLKTGKKCFNSCTLLSVSGHSGYSRLRRGQFSFGSMGIQNPMRI